MNLDAVVPDGADTYNSGLSYIHYSHSDISKGMGGFGNKVESAEQGMGAYSPQYQARGDAALVPQIPQQPQYTRLTASQQAELELARRRAQKAAEGKRANATAARRAKRRAQQRVVEGNSSDREDDREENARVPDVEAQAQNDSDIEAKLASVSDQKEAKRLKRLLRNRVSAQQARERKKSYVQDLEAKCQQSDQDKIEMEQRLKILERENVMLRQVIKNMQVNVNDDHTM